jgi:hypothetical protein
MVSEGTRVFLHKLENGEILHPVSSEMELKGKNILKLVVSYFELFMTLDFAGYSILMREIRPPKFPDLCRQ